MDLTLMSLDVARLASLLADASQLGGMPVLAGGAPEFLLRAATSSSSPRTYCSRSSTPRT